MRLNASVTSPTERLSRRTDLAEQPGPIRRRLVRRSISPDDLRLGRRRPADALRAGDADRRAHHALRDHRHRHGRAADDVHCGALRRASWLMLEDIAPDIAPDESPNSLGGMPIRTIGS